MAVAAGMANAAMAASYSGDSWYLQLKAVEGVGIAGTVNGSSWSGTAGAQQYIQVKPDASTPLTGDQYTSPGGVVFNEPSGFWTYCTDVKASVSVNGKYEYLPMIFEQANTTFPPAGVNPPWDWSSSYKGIYWAAIIYNEMASGGGALTALSLWGSSASIQHAAAQLVIWEVLYDQFGSWNLAVDGGSGFKVNSYSASSNAGKAVALATQMLNWLSGQQISYDQVWLQPLARTTGTAGTETGTFNEGSHQGLLYKEKGLRVPDGGLTLGLMGMALAFLAGFSRKLRR